MKKILIIMGRYLPGNKDGGPVRTIENLVQTLGTEYDIRILTADRDHGDSDMYPEIYVDTWNKVGNASVYYLNPRDFSFKTISRLSNECDLVYCCGLFSNYSYKILLLKKLKLIKPSLVVAPMGAFSDGAFNIKRTKKSTYLRLLSILKMYTNIYWSVTSSIEKKELFKQIGPTSNYFIAEDLPRKVNLQNRKFVKKEGNIKIVFISRISKKKNLSYAIKIIKQLSGSVEFNIYGHIEDDKYWEECKLLLNKLPDNVKWQYKGVADSEDITTVFGQHDLFLFPTLGENYGHVIFESLSAGCIPVISDTTPWLDFDKEKCGNVISLKEPELFIYNIQKYIKMSEEKYSRISKRAVGYAEKKYQESYSNNGYSIIFKEL